MHIYEINAFVWLHALSSDYGRPITLHNIPDDEIKILADLHIDAVWLMGVWERSVRGVEIALEHKGLHTDFNSTLDDFQLEDVVGSPYSVRRYVVDERLGGAEGLAAIRQQLKRFGLGLILDFVPNHIALDHPWVAGHPEYLVKGTLKDLKTEPGYFFQVGRHIFAHGRDPYFPAWTDTVQVNAFSETYRQASIKTLLDIAAQCDGVRCDMAMLLVNRVFAKTWKEEQVGAPPKTEYWDTVTTEVRAHHPRFLFIAEVYWDMEFELQQQGFDYCYDKRLYDRLVTKDVVGINQHLMAELSYQNKLIRFIENHDEARAVKALGIQCSRMAALLVATLPGAKLWHDGQFHGRTIKLPVQLGRRPIEATDAHLYQFYMQILNDVNNEVYKKGKWRLLRADEAWPGNQTHFNMVVYAWKDGELRRLIAVNFSDQRAQARVKLADLGLEKRHWKLADLLHGSVYDRIGDRMVEDGLYIDLQSWAAHLFDFTSY